MRLLPLSILLIPLFSFASPQQATIITRAGTPTAPLKYYFDLAPALADGANHAVRLTVSASNSEKTAIRFDSVKLFKKDGSLIGNNVASKTDALTANPYSFTFQNFGIAPLDLASVAGVQITFMDMGGENSTGKITVQGITVAIIRDAGEACVIADPILITTPPPPIPTITQLQAIRPLIQPGTHGDGTGEGGGGSGGGGGGSCAAGSSPSACYAGTADSSGMYAWTNTSNGTGVSDGSDTMTTMPMNTMLGTPIFFTNFGVTTSACITSAIAGVTVTVHRKAETQMIRDYNVYLTKDHGTTLSTNKSTSAAWPQAYEDKAFGGSTDNWSFISPLTTTEVASSNFGVLFTVSNNDGTSSRTASIDSVSIQVYCTTGGGSVYNSFMDLIRSVFRLVK